MPSGTDPDELRRARAVLIWMCVLICVNQLGFGGIVPAMPLYADTFGVTSTAIGAAVAIYGLARVVIAMPTGQCSDRLGRRPTLAIGGLVSALGNLWCAEADSFTTFMVARFVAGAGAGLVLTAGQIVIADISAPPYRARMMAVYQGVFLFSVGLGPFPGGWLADHYGLAAPFYAYTVMAVVVGLLAWFFVPETRGFKAADRELQTSGSRPSVPFMTQIRLLGSNLGFTLAALVSFVNAFTRTGGLFALVPLYGAAVLALNTTEIGFVMAFGSVAGMLVVYPAGAIADRHGRKFVIVPMTFLTAVAYVLFSYAPTYAWFVAAGLAWGVAAAASGSTPAAYAADRAPPGMNAAAMSLFRMLGDMGYVVGPLMLGFIADLTSTNSAFLFGALMLAATGLLFGMLAPESRPGHDR
ncbi:MAG: MFS transporter [Pseudomonadota bacterium]